MKIRIMHFPPASHHLPLLGPNISHSTLNLCSALNMRDHVSHPYKTTGKMIVLYLRLFRKHGIHNFLSSITCKSIQASWRSGNATNF